MIDADAHPTAVTGQVIDPIRNPLAQLLVQEVLAAHRLRLPKEGSVAGREGEPLRSSRIPARMVLRDRPVARATRVMPPRGKASASLAAHCRRTLSVRAGRSCSYFCRTLAIMAGVSIGRV